MEVRYRYMLERGVKTGNVFLLDTHPEPHQIVSSVAQTVRMRKDKSPG